MNLALRNFFFTPVVVIKAISMAMIAVSASSFAATSDKEAAGSQRNIDEGKFIDVNGVQQWITIRGRNTKNPVVLILHGGPGMAMSGLAPLFNEWEKDYVVVQWDQPSSGSTAVKNFDKDQGPLTIDRFTHDGIAVVQYVRKRLGKSKIVLLGNSWGTVLGLEMIKKRPELFSAYVGASQAVSGLKGGILGYELALKAARERNDRAAVGALERVGPPPYKKFEDFLVRQQYTNPPGLPPSPAEQTANAALGKLVNAPPPDNARYIAYRTLPQGFNPMANFMQVQRAMHEEVFVRWDAHDLGLTFAVPIFIFQGENDLNTPVSLAREYFDEIKAPKKAFAIIPGAGHNTLAFSREVLDLLNSHVRPVVAGTN